MCFNSRHSKSATLVVKQAFCLLPSVENHARDRCVVQAFILQVDGGGARANTKAQTATNRFTTSSFVTNSSALDTDEMQTNDETAADGLCLKVIEYLSKKGYSRTEAMLRRESAAQDAGQMHSSRTEDKGGKMFFDGFCWCPTFARCTRKVWLTYQLAVMLKTWVEDALEVYKVRIAPSSYKPMLTV